MNKYLLMGASNFKRQTSL